MLVRVSISQRFARSSTSSSLKQNLVNVLVEKYQSFFYIISMAKTHEQLLTAAQRLEYNYVKDYYKAAEKLAHMTTIIRREIDLIKRLNLIKEYIPCWCDWKISGKKFNHRSVLARMYREKHNCGSWGPRPMFPLSYMTPEQRTEWWKQMH